MGWPARLGLGIVRATLVVAVAEVGALALWDAFAGPSRYLLSRLGLGAVFASLLLLVLVVVLQTPLTGLFGWLTGRVPAATRSVLAALVVLLLFILAWAGAHPAEDALAFAAVVALFAYLVAQYGWTVQRALDGVVAARDRLWGPLRFLLLLALVPVVASRLGPLLGDRPADREQMLAVAAIGLGYVLLAPRARLIAALALVAALQALGTTPALAAAQPCPDTLAGYRLVTSGATTQAGAAGSFKATCTYAVAGASPDPNTGAASGVATGAIFATYWREQSGSDTLSGLECRAGMFDPGSTAFKGSAVLGSGTHRAFVVITPLASGGVVQIDLTSFATGQSALKRAATDLLAGVEPRAIACPASPSTTAAPRTTIAIPDLFGVIGPAQSGRDLDLASMEERLRRTGMDADQAHTLVAAVADSLVPLTSALLVLTATFALTGTQLRRAAPKA